jgi:hypothetical protein
VAELVMVINNCPPLAQRQSSWCLTLRAMSLRLYCTNFTAIDGDHLPTFCTTTEPLVPALRAMSFRL